MASLAIRGVAKSFGGVPVLRGVDLEVADGEFCVVVGRAGSGKSTLLRAIAGLEQVDAGSIEIDGAQVNDWQPAERDVAMVFQKDALLPATTVYDNIAFSLLARRMPRPDIRERVERIADLLGLSPRLGERASRLGVDDRERVAIARAAIRQAAVSLIDEPLSRLPLELRDELRGDIVRMHASFPGTKVYVTRDPVEAMMLAERTVLIHDGRVEQEGTPISLFERPATIFVAGFFGSPKMNLLSGRLNRTGAADAVMLDGSDVVVPIPPQRVPAGIADGTPVILGLRPEHMVRAVRVSPPDGTLRHEAEIEMLRLNGARIYATFRLGGAAVVAELQAHDVSRPGDRVPIDINLKRASIFDAKTEKAIDLIGRPPA
jgi:multiple sugar transport system ATP-binding protein